jgi:hypothetical protein
MSDDINVYAATDIECDADGLRHHLNLYVKALGVGYKKLLRKHARLMCEDMLDYELPYQPEMTRLGGRGGAAQRKGMDVVEGQIWNVFKPLGEASFHEIAKQDDYGIFAAYIGDRNRNGLQVPHWLQDGLWGTAEWQRFKAAFGGDIDSFDVGASFDAVQAGENQIKTIHEAARGGTNVANYNTKGSGQYFLADAQHKLPGYIARVQKRVGRLKAGWYSAGSQFGKMNKVGQWIIGNQWGTGIVEDQSDDKKTPAITVGNAAHGRMTKDPGYNAFKKAIAHRAYSIRVDLIKMMIKKGKKAELIELAQRAENAHLFILNDDPF